MSRSHHYASWHQWRWHSHVHMIVTIVGIVMMISAGFLVTGKVYAASVWSQSDWSGGVGGSATTQYTSINNVQASSQGIRLGLSGNWFNEAWKYRKNITIDNRTVTLGTTSDELNDFPLLVKLNASRINYAQVNSDGSDIRFTDPAQPQVALPYVIDTWNPSGDSFVWVKVPKINSNSNTGYISVYYGNAAATTAESSTTVWDSNTTAEYHLSDNASAGVKDATAGGLDATKSAIGLPAYTANGKIGGALLFDGTHYISRPSITSYGVSRTVEFWFNSANINDGQRGLMTVGNTMAEGNPAWLLVQDSSARVSYYSNNYFSGSTAIQPNTWYYVAYTFDAATNRHKIYVNNSNEVDTVKTDSNGANTNLYIGGGYQQAFKGMMDDVTISNNVARSAGWLAAKYRNGNDQSTTFSTAETVYSGNGLLLSSIYDTHQPSTWKAITYTATGGPVDVKVRTSDSSTMAGATDFASCNVIVSGALLGSSTCVTEGQRYIQYQASFTTTDGTTSPELTNITFNFDAFDPTPPATNASNLTMKRTTASSPSSAGSWINSTTPLFAWSGGADNSGGSGIKGYCLYLGQDVTANLLTTKGLLGTSQIDTGGVCAYAVSATSLNTADAGVLSNPLVSSNSDYYLLVKAIDNANNIFGGPVASYNFKFDNTPPTVPSFITAPSQFVSNKEVTLTWPSSGSESASDTNSGLLGLQYRIGNSGNWYGQAHIENTLTDVLANDGSYTTVSVPDFNNLNDGNNLVSFRTIDTAGNISTAYVTTVIKLNTTSPSSPRNVTATPSLNSINSFGFSWLEPASFTGSVSNLVYCYTINALPTSSNCSYTTGGTKNLPAGAYATQPGENTFYVVAKDEAGNLNYATAASTTFDAHTSAPSIPLNLEIADISNRATSTWKLALSWNQPAIVGAGVNSYKIFQSIDGTSFSEVASSAGASYVNNGLTNNGPYYYKVRACDSANNCGAFSSIVSKRPTGRFTTPAELISQPSVTVSTRVAKIVWTTNRNSDSRVQYGVVEGQYLPTEAASSDATLTHQIELNNLVAGTTYHYRARWIDEDGNVGTSSELTFTTLQAPTIKNVTIVRTTLSTVTLQFTSSNATSVKLFFGKGNSFGGLKIINTSRSESTYTVELDGLDDGVQYLYKLNPIDVDGNEYDSTQQSTFTTPQRPRISNLRFQPVKDKPTSTQSISWTTNVPTTSLIRFGAERVSTVEVFDSTLVKDHTLVVEGLLDDTNYTLRAESRDGDGNVALSDSTSFHTALDTRPPSILSVNVQTSIRGNGSDARGQIIVAWKTDEPSTSQVAYRTGRGAEYTSKTAEDSKRTTDHVVVVSDLTPSNVYHLQVISKDKSGNQVAGDDQAAIIGRPTDNVMTIILSSLQRAFGF